MTDTERWIKDLVDAHHILVFTKSGHCPKVKGIFSKLGVLYHEVDLDHLENGKIIQRTLKKMTGHRTVPSIWIGKKFIGGSDGMYSLSCPPF
uniref:Glutaredoxin domain-containing protein n=1 Tax=Arcella intermedia TaxID=1963864 RepID=A0A6B2LVM1_9EUKA